MAPCPTAGDSLRGGDPEVRGVAADGAGQVDVAAGDAADIVARERYAYLGVGEREVGVVVGLLGGGADAVHELQPG